MHTSREECEAKHRVYKNTNERYKHFFQMYFTAGDEEQFLSHRNYSENNPLSASHLNTDFQFDIWQGYEHATAETVTNTFLYLFNKFKKGIYIRILDNKLVTFLPFSKVKYTNEWADRIRIDEKKYKNIFDVMRHVAELDHRHFSEKRINKFVEEWYANNCLFRNEYPVNEGDTGMAHIKNMFEELCSFITVPDLEFFVNRRDFPLLKRDLTEPYDHIFDSDTVPLLSHKFDTYAPLFSSVSNSAFADIAIPTTEDWARVKAKENIFFEKTHTRDFTSSFNMPWKDKKPIAVFRGSSTGAGVTIDSNPRLKIAYLSTLQHKDEVDGQILLDAGITEWNVRPRKIRGEKYIQVLDYTKLNLPTLERLGPEQQSQFKYIVHIQGHVSAFRLSLELSMGCTILIVESQFHLLYEHLLQPFVHYIPVKQDLSDLYEKILYCKRNDDVAETIAKNAKLFYQTYLEKDGILKYLKDLLFAVRAKVGNEISYKNRSFLSFAYPILPLLEAKESVGVKETRNCKLYAHGDKLQKHLKHGNYKHEAFVYEYGLKDLPHFCRIFGTTTSGDIILEKLPGTNALEWIQNKYSMDNFMFTVIQIISALYEAQNKCGFVHNDLMPWNIMVEERKEKREMIIETDTEIYEVSGNAMNVHIIDYGKAHIVYNNNHCGVTRHFEMNGMYDVCCFLFSSLACLLKRETTKKDENLVLHILNFFAGTSVLPNKIFFFPKARRYIQRHSSFTYFNSIAFNDSRSPLEFLKYIDSIYPQRYLTWKTKILNMPIYHLNIKKRDRIAQLYFENLCVMYYFFQKINCEHVYDIFLAKRNITDAKIDNFSFPSEIIFWKKERLIYLKESLEKENCQKEKFEMIVFCIRYRGKFQILEEDKSYFFHLYEANRPFGKMKNSSHLCLLSSLFKDCKVH